MPYQSGLTHLDRADWQPEWEEGWSEQTFEAGAREVFRAEGWQTRGLPHLQCQWARLSSTVRGSCSSQAEEWTMATRSEDGCASRNRASNRHQAVAYITGGTDPGRAERRDRLVCMRGALLCRVWEAVSVKTVHQKSSNWTGMGSGWVSGRTLSTQSKEWHAQRSGSFEYECMPSMTSGCARSRLKTWVFMSMFVFV